VLSPARKTVGIEAWRREGVELTSVQDRIRRGTSFMFGCMYTREGVSRVGETEKETARKV
jgi:hypothetical protein